jgi:hypothetical protein
MFLYIMTLVVVVEGLRWKFVFLLFALGFFFKNVLYLQSSILHVPYVDAVNITKCVLYIYIVLQMIISL